MTAVGDGCARSIPLLRRRSMRAVSPKGEGTALRCHQPIERLIPFLAKGLSVGTSLHRLRQGGGTHLPSQRTAYCHLNEGVIQLPGGGCVIVHTKSCRSAEHAKPSVFRKGEALRNARRRSANESKAGPLRATVWLPDATATADGLPFMSASPVTHSRGLSGASLKTPFIAPCAAF